MFSKYTHKCNLNLPVGRVLPFLFQFSGKSQLFERIMCLSYAPNLAVNVEYKKGILFACLRKVWLPLCRILRSSSHLINYVAICFTELIVQKLYNIRVQFYLRPYGKCGFPYMYRHKSLNHSVELRGDIMYQVLLKATKKCW